MSAPAREAADAPVAATLSRPQREPIQASVQTVPGAAPLVRWIFARPGSRGRR